MRGLEVSIVIDNHNYGRFLQQAIDSALDQEYAPLEVIVVDDGSTDDSREILAGYGDRVRGVLKENGGQASALNAGFAASRGDIVLFLDADDFLLPGAVSAAARAWRPGLAKVQFPLAVVDGWGQPSGAYVPPDAMESGDLGPTVLRTGRHPWPGITGTFFDRSVLERIMPIPEVEWRRQPDVYILALSALFGDVLSLDRTLGSYRVHGGNGWARTRLDVARLREQVFYDERRAELLARWAPRTGVDSTDGWWMRDPEHLQGCLALRRLEPRSAVHREHGALSLVIYGIRASLGCPFQSARKRFFFALWFLLAGALPRPLARPLIVLSFVKQHRPRFLQALIT